MAEPSAAISLVKRHSALAQDLLDLCAFHVLV